MEWHFCHTQLNQSGKYHQDGIFFMRDDFEVRLRTDRKKTLAAAQICAQSKRKHTATRTCNQTHYKNPRSRWIVKKIHLPIMPFASVSVQNLIRHARPNAATETEETHLLTPSKPQDIILYCRKQQRIHDASVSLAFVLLSKQRLTIVVNRKRSCRTQFPASIPTALNADVR